MKLQEVKDILEADVLWGGEFLENDVSSAFGSDLISDVLAFASPSGLLLTGLTNGLVIKTAEMLDMAAVVFVRGKRPPEPVIREAAAKGIPLLVTRLLLYESCGRLYQAGLRGCAERGDGHVRDGRG